MKVCAVLMLLSFGSGYLAALIDERGYWRYLRQKQEPRAPQGKGKPE